MAEVGTIVNTVAAHIHTIQKMASTPATLKEVIEKVGRVTEGEKEREKNL
jgi:hypothetical protein